MEGQGNPPNKRAELSLPGAAATAPGASRDRLIRLPDSLLVCILLKLGTNDAIKASALSRHWGRVWAQIPDLNFDDVGSSVPACALAAYKAHGGDDIHSLTVSLNQANAQETTAWLSLAAPLLSGRLHVDHRRKVTRETLQLFLGEEDAMVRRAAIELLCFKKATEILMDLGFHALALPPSGVFDLLRVMLLEHFWFRGQISVSNTMFPSLQKLTIRRVRGLVGLTLNSKSLLNIRLSLLLEIQRLNILAPELNKLEVTFCFYNAPTPVASIAAEKLEKLRWEVPCVPELKGMPQLRVLGAPPITMLWPEDICAEYLNCFPAVNHLELQIRPGLRTNGSLVSLEDITIPSVNTLGLYLETNDHVFEGRVLQLLAKCSGIRKLNLSFQSRHEVQGSCLPHCICHTEPRLWEAEVVQMGALEEVEIVNFHGAAGEAYLVEQLVKRAPTLEQLRVTSKVEDHFLDYIGNLCPPKCTVEIVVALE